MELYIYFIAALLILATLALVVEFFGPRESSDTFPDDKFLSIWKRYSTTEIAKALDEIADGV